MKKEIELTNWKRKEHFEFFSQFSEPFYGITVRVDCTEAYQKAKKKGYSFFLYYLHASLKAANSIENFAYRIVDGKVFHYDQVNASPTINRDNGTFGFSYMTYDVDFEKFSGSAKKVIDEVRNSSGLHPAVSGENVIHFSSLPWLDFTAISDARHFDFPDSCPKISFGKMTIEGDRRMMPVSVHVHHALVDGYHVGQFVERLQECLNE